MLCFDPQGMVRLATNAISMPFHPDGQNTPSIH